MATVDFSGTTVGRRFSVGPVIIRKEAMFAFAREYDPLPVHFDEERAKATRHGRLIAPGVMSFMLIWAEFIKINPWGDNLLGGINTRIEWLAPVYAGDTLRGDIALTATRRRNPYNGVVEVTSAVFNAEGVQVIHDVTELVVSG